LLDHLSRLRAAADAGVLSPAAAFQAYSKIMDALFDVDSSSYQGNELVVDHQTDASIDAARALEYASREAALVDGAAAAHGQMSASDRELFASAVADQRLLIGDALGTFSAQLRGPWARAYDSRAHRQFMVLENRIAGSIGSRAPIPVNIRTWQTVSRKFQAGVEEVEIRAAPPLAALGARTGNRLLLEAVLAGGLGLVAVVASILLTLWFGRRLTGELTTLHDSAQQMAAERLPRVVQRLRDGQEVDVGAESPLPPPGGSPRSPGWRMRSSPCSGRRCRPRWARPTCARASTRSSSTCRCATSRCCTGSWACSTPWSGPPTSPPPWPTCSAWTT
jgi:hypothetical protein